ncbi:MAG: divergent polysaccharide deacetylase family protein [Candidatus Marinimicrobia bacterium]|nr:divergent polysaccharide deacetylase family protein [Candidatus Neomarinimicrobiota bacterium]
MNRSSKKRILILVVLFLIIDAAIIFRIYFREEISPFRGFANLDSYLQGEFSSSLKEKGLIIDQESTDGNLYMRYRKGYGKYWLERVIRQSLSPSGLISEFDWNVNNGFNIILTHPIDGNRTLKFREDERKKGGLICIIIDDFGYFWDERVDELMSFDIPMAFAVIPGHEYSERIAKSADSNGKELLLHLPMEAFEHQGGEDEYIIKYNMDIEEIESRVSKALETVPGASGINNHQGSRVTADSETFQRFLAVISPYNLYFIDSVTHSSSVAFRDAQNAGVPAGRRTVFLDDPEDEKTIDYRIEQLKNRAHKNGNAIGIGHINSETIMALKNRIPFLIEEGYLFVYPSQLVN